MVLIYIKNHKNHVGSADTAGAQSVSGAERGQQNNLTHAIGFLYILDHTFMWRMTDACRSEPVSYCPVFSYTR